MIPTPEESGRLNRGTELSELADQLVQLMKQHELTDRETTCVVRDVLIALTPRIESFVDQAKRVVRVTTEAPYQAKLTPKGRVMFPWHIREHLEMSKGDYAEFIVQPDGTVVVQRAELVAGRARPKPMVDVFDELYGLATETFDTNDAAAAWLRRPHPMLGGMSPLKYAKSEADAQHVKDLLVAVKYGGVV